MSEWICLDCQPDLSQVYQHIIQLRNQYVFSTQLLHALLSGIVSVLGCGVGAGEKAQSQHCSGTM